MSKNTETVKVIVRCRPMNKNEVGRGSKPIVHMDQNNSSCTLEDPQEKPRTFTFDCVFGAESKQ